MNQACRSLVRIGCHECREGDARILTADAVDLARFFSFAPVPR